jgi:repressor LexA
MPPHALAALKDDGSVWTVPVFDSVPAGLFKDAGVVLETDDVPTLLVSAAEAGHDPRAFALTVTGDSMVEASIHDGDILLVSPAQRVGDGDIAVVLVHQTATTVKKVYVTNGQLILQPANHRYRPEVLAYPSEAEILGKVIQVRRQL